MSKRPMKDEDVAVSIRRVSEFVPAELAETFHALVDELLRAREREKKLHKRNHDMATENWRRQNKLWRELQDYRFSFALAREHLDPERLLTGYSQVDLAVAALDHAACQRIRAAVLKSREGWKNPLAPEKKP